MQQRINNLSKFDCMNIELIWRCPNLNDPIVFFISNMISNKCLVLKERNKNIKDATKSWTLRKQIFIIFV